jgi:hypothetical protein
MDQAQSYCEQAASANVAAAVVQESAAARVQAAEVVVEELKQQLSQLQQQHQQQLQQQLALQKQPQNAPSLTVSDAASRGDEEGDFSRASRALLLQKQQLEGKHADQERMHGEEMKRVGSANQLRVDELLRDRQTAMLRCEQLQQQLDDAHRTVHTQQQEQQMLCATYETRIEKLSQGSVCLWYCGCMKRVVESIRAFDCAHRPAPHTFTLYNAATADLRLSFSSAATIAGPSSASVQS